MTTFTLGPKFFSVYAEIQDGHKKIGKKNILLWQKVLDDCVHPLA